MTCRAYLSSVSLNILLLVAGVALLSEGSCRQAGLDVLAGGCLCGLSVLVYFKRRHELKEKCWLMLEAIRNSDYSFRLPVGGGWMSSERILQHTLNEFGGLMGRQKQLMEQRERFYGLILSCVTSGIIVLDERQQVVLTNPAVLRLLDVPALGTLRQLEQRDGRLATVLRELPAGERATLRFVTKKGEVRLQVRASGMELGGNRVRVLALNDIRQAMEGQEVDSWMRLTRVLTHEIMNSIAPISSLSEVFLQRPDVVGTPLYEGIRAIHDTSVGLMAFVDSYRKFSALQEPSPEPFCLGELIGQIQELRLLPDAVTLTLQIEPPDLMVYADPNLIRQVFINLLKNAVQAIGGQAGRIHIRAFVSAEEHVFVYVSNSGPAVPEAEADSIFVPFFTTKPKGSGIGLSLTRQIMQLSHGSISLLKAGTNGWNTTFLLEFE